MGESIWEYFHLVRDPRVERTRKHELHDILVIAICSVICGAEGWCEMEEFGLSNEDWFREFLDLPHGIPSHDTFGRVFAALDPDEFEAAFRSWVEAVCETSAGKHISIDGKALRHSFDTASGRGGQCAQRFGVLARNHWSVENNLHWQLDVAFGEDDSRVRVGNAAENLSRVRRIALMLLKQEKTAKVGVKARRKKAGWDRKYLLKVLQGD